MITPEAVDYRGILERPDPLDIDTTDEEDARVVALVLERYEHAKRAKEKYSRVWELLLLYIRGEQLLYRDTSTGELVRVADKHSKRLWSINNYLKPTCTALQAKLERHIPSFSVAPANGDQDQIQASLAATAFIEFFKYKEDFDVLLGDVYHDVSQIGAGLWELYWDPEAGREMVMCDACGYFDDTHEAEGEACPLCAAEAVDAVHAQYDAIEAEDAEIEMQGGMPDLAADAGVEAPEVPTLELFWEGDAKVCYLDPHNFFPEPGCYELKKLRYYMTRTVEPLSELARRFPHYAEYLHAEGGLYDNTSVRTVYSNSSGEWSQDELDEHAVLYAYHEAPSEEHKDGQLIYIINNQLVEQMAHPYWRLLKRPTVFGQFWEKDNDTLWPQPWAEQAWHRQKELNELETNIREHEEMATHVKIMNPIGSQVNAKEITATTQQVIKHNPTAGRIEPLKMPDLNQGTYERKESLKSDIQMQAHVTSTETGQMPEGDSGRSMAIFESQADAAIQPMMKRNNAELAAFWRCVILLIMNRYHPDRQFKVLGDTDGLQVYTIKDMNLVPGFDLRLEMEDGLSKIQAVRINQLLEIHAVTQCFGNQALGEPFDMAKFCKAARVRFPGVGPDSTSTEYTAANALVKRLERGEQVQPMPWDNPMIFAEVFVGWLKANGRAPDADPMVVQLISQYYEYYVSWAMTGMQPHAPGLDTMGGAQGDGAGGTPSEPGAMVGGGGSVEGGGDPGAAAASRIQEADAAGEFAARSQSTHEN